MTDARRSVLDNELYPPRPTQLAECWIREWKEAFGRWPTKGRWPGAEAGFSRATYLRALASLRHSSVAEGSQS